MKRIARLKWDGPLILIMMLSAFLNGYNIWNEQYANTYYTTAVASMLQSFHNFFFASLDSAGTVTVDKPPVVFWIQTASAWLFGVHGWSVILPQAVAGVGSVLLMYLLVKPAFGTAAARISALVMACTPIAVAVSRTNNIDSMLVFTLLFAAWLLFRGLREELTWSIVGAFAVIGIGFNMKMLQAYMVVPAFGLLFLIASKPGWRAAWKKKTGILAGSLVALILITLSWPVIVDSIPEDQRPYIGSSETNSVLELAFGYNGISRLTGENGGGGGSFAPGDRAGSSATNPGTAVGAAGLDGRGNPGGAQAQAQQPGMNGQMQLPPGQANNAGAGGFPGPDGNGGGSSGRFNTGTVGPLRLFQTELAGQASWLIPFAFLSAIGILVSLRRRNFTDAHKEVIFWLAWLVPGMIFFSIAEFFHHYYLIMLAPPIAALTGAGWSKLWAQYRVGTGGFTTWLFPAGLAATAALQWYMLQPYEAQIGKAWSMGITAAGALVVVMLIVLKLARQQTALSVAIAGMLVLLVAPMYWAATPITYGQNSMLPQAGPGTANMRGGMGGVDGPTAPTAAGAGSAQVGRNGQAVPAFAGQGQGQGFGGPGGETAALNETLYSYLKEQNTGEAYLFATVHYNTAAPYIIDKGESVIIMGGFSGNDPAVTTEELEAWVAEGKLKYVLAGGGMGGRGGSTQLTAWLQEHGRVVPAEEWGGTGNANGAGDGNVLFGGGGRFGSMTLYEVTLAQGGAAQ